MSTVELKSKATLDNSNFNQGIKEVEKNGVNAMEEISQKNKQVTKSFLEVLAPMAMLVTAVRGGMQAFNALADQGKEINKSAKEMGVSANYFASIQANAKGAGLSTDQFNEALKKVKDGTESLESLNQKWLSTGDAISRAESLAQSFNAIQANDFREGLSTSQNWLQSKIINPAFGFLMSSNAQPKAQVYNALASGNYSQNDVEKIVKDLVFNRKIKASEAQQMIGYGLQANAQIQQDRNTIKTNDQTNADKAESAVIKSIYDKTGDKNKALSIYMELTQTAIDAREFNRLLNLAITDQDRISKIVKARADVEKANLESAKNLEKIQADEAKQREEHAKARTDFFKLFSKMDNAQNAYGIYSKSNLYGKMSFEDFKANVRGTRDNSTEAQTTRDIALADENAKFEQAKNDLRYTLPESYGLNQAGGDLVGRERSTYSMKMAEVNKQVEEIKLSNEHLKAIAEILRGN